MTTIDHKDLLILRKLEWRGRIDFEEIGKSVTLPKAAVLKKMERMEQEGIIKNISLSLFPPPVLGGEWKWMETSIVTKGPNEEVLMDVKQNVSYLSEVLIHTPIPKGILPDLVLLYYSQDPKKDLKVLRSQKGVEYAESTLLKTYTYPIPVELSREEWRFIQFLQKNILLNSNQISSEIGKEKKWVESKLERLLWTEENRKGVFLALPSFDYSQISNYSHIHFSLEVGKGFDRKEFESKLNGSGILLLPSLSVFRGSDLMVESDIWGLQDLEKKLDFLRKMTRIELKGMVMYRKNIAHQPWLSDFIEERLRG